jgi:hypothetical protein
MEPADPAGRVDPGWVVTVDADARLERTAMTPPPAATGSSPASTTLNCC